MIKFDCKNCIHFPVCKFKDDAACEIETYNNRIGENEMFSINLNCKHYASISVPTLKEFNT